MIKNKIVITLLLIGFSLLSFGQKSLSAEENTGLDKLIKNNVLNEYESITSKAIPEVVTGSFFYVKIQNMLDKNLSYHEYRLMEIEGRMIELNDIKKLLSVIKKDFKMDSEENAMKFEKMLNALFPTMYLSSVKHYKKNNSWIFVRESSFGETNGYEVKIDEKGTIISIEDKDNIQE